MRLRLATARQRVERDPLGTEVGLTDSLVPVLRDVRARLAALLTQKMADQTVARRARDDAEAAILRARDLLDTLRSEQADAYTRYLRCQAEITLAQYRDTATGRGEDYRPRGLAHHARTHRE